MKKFHNKIILVIFVVFFLFIFTETTYMIDWRDFEQQNLNKLKNNNSLKKEIIYNYNLSIAYANLGEIKKSQNTLDKIEKKAGKNKFKQVIFPYIKDTSYNSNNLLDLNYAAFYYLIDEKYSKSSIYFEKIIDKRPKNIWSLNYLAGNYIMLDQLDKAEKYLIKADNINSNKFTNLLHGYIYYEKGNYVRAFSKFSQTGDLLEEDIFK